MTHQLNDVLNSLPLSTGALGRVDAAILSLIEELPGCTDGLHDSARRQTGSVAASAGAQGEH